MKYLIAIVLFAALLVPAPGFAVTVSEVAGQMEALRNGSLSPKDLQNFCDKGLAAPVAAAEKAALHACRSYTQLMAGEAEAAAKDAAAGLEADKNSYLANLAQVSVLVAASNYGEASAFLSAAQRNAPTPELAEALKQKAILFQNVGIFVSAEDLVAAYSKDPAAAESAYSNKIITISGIVSEVGLDDFGDPQVTIFTDAENKKGILFGFSSKQQDDLAKLAKGKQAFISGKCGGGFPQIIMGKCSVLNF